MHDKSSTKFSKTKEMFEKLSDESSAEDSCGKLIFSETENKPLYFYMKLDSSAVIVHTRPSIMTHYRES